MEDQLKKYIAPNTLAMIGTSCYVLADTFFISVAAGADGITALNLILPVYGIIYAIGSMIGIGSATRYSLGKFGGLGGADEYFSNSIFWTLLASSIFVLGGALFPREILTLLGADRQILSIGLSYTSIVLCFTPFFMLNYTFTAFARNDGAPKLAMAATLTSGIFNIIFDYVLMFPLGMGMAGAALATGLSPIVSMGVCMLHYMSPRCSVRLKFSVPSVRRFVSACSLGIAAFVGELSNAITTLVFNFILLRLSGNTAVAAYGVIANVALVGTALFNGVSLGLQPVTSAAHGRMDFSAETRIRRSAIRIGLYIAVVLVALAIVFARQIVGVFNSEGSAELAACAIDGMRLYFPGFLLAAVNIVNSGFYSAIGNGRASSVIALSRGVVSISAMAFLLSELLGVAGVWLAFPASELITWLLSRVVGRVKGEG